MSTLMTRTSLPSHMVDKPQEKFEGFPSLRFDSLVDYQDYSDWLIKKRISFKTRIVKKRKQRTQYLILLVEDSMIDGDGNDVCPHCGSVLIDFNWCKHCGDIELLDEFKEQQEDSVAELDFDNDDCPYRYINGTEY